MADRGHSSGGRVKLGFFWKRNVFALVEVQVYMVWRWRMLAGGGVKGSTNHHKGTRRACE